VGSLAAHLARRPGEDVEAVARMLRRSAHRGAPGATVTLGRCTVGITVNDVPADAAEEEGIAAAVLGDLDDHAELTASLGLAPDASTATTVATAVRRWGADSTASRLRGRVAVVATDGERLWAFRDHVGLRTLHLHEGGAGHSVASEAKQAAAGGGVLAPDAGAVVDRFFERQAPNDTVWPGVRRLPSATVVEIGAAAPRERRYWNPGHLLETWSGTEGDAVDAFRAALDRAVVRCFRGDDAVALSGGIDSTSIAGAAAPLHIERCGGALGAVSSVYPAHPGVDEGPLITEAAARFGLDLHTFESRARPLDDLERWSRILDSPLHPLSGPELAELYGQAVGSGYRTILLGNEAELVYDQRHQLLPYLVTHGRLAAARALVVQKRRQGRRWAGVARLLAEPVIPAFRGAGPDAVPWLSLRPGRRQRARSPRRAWSDDQLAGIRSDAVLPSADEIIADTAGVVGRLPFFDVDLWELVLSLPAEVKFPGGRYKGFVRDAMRGTVPDSILDRPKTLFNSAVASTVDHAALRRWLLDAPVRIEGVDYRLLEQRLRGPLPRTELAWANALATVHAFLEIA
jgi:asparagine synthase (glutamine-hydrolysing)